MYKLKTFCLIAFIVTSTLCLAEEQGLKRGDLIEFKRVYTLSKKASDLTKRISHIEALGSALTTASFYQIKYSTIDVQGNPTLASGLAIVPDQITEPVPMISYQHGTTQCKNTVPSRYMINLDDAGIGAVFGSMGYFLVATDYLGLGDSPGLHPYLHAESEATAAADMIVAGKNLAAKLSKKLDGKLFLMGYSQGGHATMALHRYLERNEIPVSMSVPMAGPYDLYESSRIGILKAQTRLSDFLAAFVVFSMSNIYHLNLPDFVMSPQAQRLPELFTGLKMDSQVMSALPEPGKLLVPNIEKILDSSGLGEALKKNDVYSWRPIAPVKLLHSKGDHLVVFENSQRAYDTMKALGADVELIELEAEAQKLVDKGIIDANTLGSLKLDHIEASLPALLGAYYFFEKFRAANPTLAK